MQQHYETLAIANAAGPYNGIPAENVFIAYDRLGTQFGVGTIQYQYQPHLFPDRPHQMYVELNSQPCAEYLLLGALLGRAQQLWVYFANAAIPARVYTALSPEDENARGFYVSSGFSMNATQCGVRLTIPQTQLTEHMSMVVRPITLSTPQEQLDCIARLQNNDVTDVDQGFLSSVMCLPHYQHLGLFHADHMDQSRDQLVGEVILSGEQGSAEVLAIYILPPFRCRGLGRFLLHRAMVVAASAGVHTITMRVLSSSQPQVHLVSHFQPELVKKYVLFPSLDLNPITTAHP